MSKHEHNYANVAQGIVRKEDETLTLVEQSDEVLVANDAASRGAARTCRLSKSDIQRKVDDYIRGLVRELCPTLDARVTEQLDRRVDVAVKSMDGHIKKQIADTLNELIAKRLQEQVASLRIDLDVTVTQPKD